MTSNTVSHTLSGKKLLGDPRHNKGTAFTHAEREKFGLLGLLPSRVETLAEQATRAYEQYISQADDLRKNLYLNDLFATNTTLFYHLVSSHLTEMLPVVYTPTIGDAVKQYSRSYVRPHGMIISLADQDRIDAIFANIPADELDIAVVTDGEGVLGIGDQGIGGLNIAIGKLMVYTLCGGLNPHRTLPVLLDAGTNNEELLADPLYLGLRRQRASGEEYLSFIDKFVTAFKKRFPRAFLHWEDFGRDNARTVLDRYRESHPSFNDDIQGTGAVALAAVLSGISKSQMPTAQHRFCIFGAGTAGCGIADQISKALAQSEGKDPAEIRRRFYLIDREGLLTSRSGNLMSFQAPYAVSAAELDNWNSKEPGKISLADVVRNARPTVLIGCSAQSGAFTDEILAEMVKNSKHPVIMPLSNPTSKAEATPERIFAATQGNALVATGSPFGSATWQGQTMPVAQCNNALVFPGIGLGMLISQAQQLTDNMLLAASSAVSRSSSEAPDSNRLLPGFDNILKISRTVALAVAETAMQEGAAQLKTDRELEAALTKHTWAPEYSNSY
ncbi:MAG: NAD-dependent malic enzyme [Candidatus Riflebacteria bacterium HGW-Riflebacteria-1]|jgi:malate dehydrogenase (oxaloacetate-decarboxylating)|nr:MAG: NAD-dependent malic enzyme [Candidatus Riflebacteria bacterium HGW-Riflebacteria-1]